ncbi:hypothetical protein JHK82_048004 [Glycine max]|nr:hypothetical protein JHK82_048004 [Glycine max]
MFNLSSNYLHSLSESHPNPHNSFLNLDYQGQRSEPNCTFHESLPSSLATPTTTNQYLLGHDNINNNARQQLHPFPQTKCLLRNSKKRSRASRLAPTTVLTTDTNNFRPMVQEFTGTPTPPFSPSFSRPNHLLSTTSSRTLIHKNPIEGTNNNGYVDIAERAMWPMKCPPLISRSLRAPPSDHSRPVSKVVVSIDNDDYPPRIGV